MNEHTQRIFSFAANQQQRARSAWSTVNRQPNWITRAAAMTFLIVLAVIVLVPVMLAILAAVIVFGVLALAYAGVEWVKRLFRPADRENVRIIRREP